MLNDVASVSISRTQLDYNVDSSTAEVTVAESRHIKTAKHEPLTPVPSRDF